MEVARYPTGARVADEEVSEKVTAWRAFPEVLEVSWRVAAAEPGEVGYVGNSRLTRSWAMGIVLWSGVSPPSEVFKSREVVRQGVAESERFEAAYQLCKWRLSADSAQRPDGSGPGSSPAAAKAAPRRCTTTSTPI